MIDTFSLRSFSSVSQLLVTSLLYTPFDSRHQLLSSTYLSHHALAAVTGFSLH